MRSANTAQFSGDGKTSKMFSPWLILHCKWLYMLMQAHQPIMWGGSAAVDWVWQLHPWLTEVIKEGKADWQDGWHRRRQTALSELRRNVVNIYFEVNHYSTACWRARIFCAFVFKGLASRQNCLHVFKGENPLIEYVSGARFRGLDAFSSPGWVPRSSGQFTKHEKKEFW